MSTKTVVIERKGEETTQTSISEIETNKVGGGSATWIPKSDVDCGAITIKRNGTYKAEDTNYYAFDKVVVKSNGKAYGRKKDGKKYLVKPDGNGYLKYVEMPESMSILSLPNKTSYTKGETIDKTGLRTAVLYKDGSVYTQVEASALRIEPTTATSSTIKVFWDLYDDGDFLETFSTKFSIVIGE